MCYLNTAWKHYYFIDKGKEGHNHDFFCYVCKYSSNFISQVFFLVLKISEIDRPFLPFTKCALLVKFYVLRHQVDVIKQWFFSISHSTGLCQASLGVLWCLDSLNYACSPASKFHPRSASGVAGNENKPEGSTCYSRWRKTNTESELYVPPGRCTGKGPRMGSGRKRSIRDKCSLTHLFLIIFLWGNARALWTKWKCSRSVREESKSHLWPQPLGIPLPTAARSELVCFLYIVPLLKW